MLRETTILPFLTINGDLAGRVRFSRKVDFAQKKNDFAGKRRFFLVLGFTEFAQLGAFDRPPVLGEACAFLAVGVGKTLCGRRAGQCCEMGAPCMADGLTSLALSDGVRS